MDDGTGADPRFLAKKKDSPLLALVLFDVEVLHRIMNVPSEFACRAQ